MAMMRLLGPTAEPGPTGTQAAAPAAATTDVEVGIGWVILPVLAVFGAWLAILSLRGGLPAAPKLVDGVSALALFYVGAQVIERLFEPFAGVVLSTGGERKRLALAIADAYRAKNHGDEEATAAKTTAANAKNALEQKRAKRAIVFWALASILGMIVSALAGLYFLNALLAEGSHVDLGFDVLVTGLLMGSGSKPLHDLITRIQSSKEKATDPLETNV